MPNENELIQGIDRFLYQDENDSNNDIENKIMIPFSQVFRYVNGSLDGGASNSIRAYPLENFYQDTLNMFEQPMYVYYGNIDPYQNNNINIWIDTSEDETENEGQNGEIIEEP